MKNKNRIKGLAVAIAVSMVLSACGSGQDVNSSAQSQKEVTGAATENESVQAEKEAEKRAPQEIADDYVKSLMESSLYPNFEIVAHSVSETDSQSSENGKYDASDIVEIKIQGVDSLGVLAQSQTTLAEFKREAGSDNWELSSETCKKWDVDHKKLGGTVWKKTMDDGSVLYFRFRDTLEFFYTKLTQDKSSEVVNFDTTMLGARAIEKDGEVSIERIHVITGSVTRGGEISLTMQVGTDSEKETETIILNEFEKIEKTDVPFTEEEYKEAADQR